jgi:hypothetical protein
VVPVPDRPYFFLPTLLFFHRDWLCDPIFSTWLRAAHTACQNGVCCHTNYWTKLPKFVHRKYASLVNIDVGTLQQIAQQKTAKTMKKIFLKIIYFRPTDPNFFTIWNRNHRYFFYALCIIKSSWQIDSILPLKQLQVEKDTAIWKIY